jgi:hypothetical protein
MIFFSSELVRFSLVNARGYRIQRAVPPADLRRAARRGKWQLQLTQRMNRFLKIS